MEPLPSWMRRALVATAVMNVLAALGFLPGAGAVRALAGLPQDGQPLYLLTVALFVGLFGLGYLVAGVTGRPDRVFLGVAAAGKIGFFTLLLGFWIAGSVPLQAPVLGSADLLFGTLFVIWLLGSRAPA
jgi:hypothetical protein